MMRVAIVIVGIIATAIALSVHTIYGIFILCTDLVYVILFPQLLCVVHLPFANAYGALISFVVSFLLRMLSGEPLFGFPAAIKWPYAVDNGNGIWTQRFPFKTLIMLLGLILIVIVSYIVEKLFKNGTIPAKYDVFEQVVRKRATTESIKAAKAMNMTSTLGTDYALAGKEDFEEGSPKMDIATRQDRFYTEEQIKL